MKQIFLLTLAAVALMAADATGIWTGTLTVSQSDGTDKPGPAYLVLKQEGSKISGSAGPNAEEQHPMREGKVDNGTITFDLPAGDSFMKFKLKQEGEEIKGSVAREREGETQTAKLAVKREAPKP
jgi:hypothetical protein